MKSGLRLLLIAMALTLVLVSCAKATPTPAPATPAPVATPKPAATPAPAPATPTPAPATPAPTEKPFAPMTLRTNVFGPQRAFTAGYEYVCDEVEKATNGAVKCEHFYTEALGKAPEQLDNIKSGLFDIGLAYPGYAPAKTPLRTLVSTLPALTSDIIAYSKAMNDISKLPAMEAEIKQWNAEYLFTAPIPNYNYMGTKPVRTLEDFKALRVVSTGEHARLLTKLGAVPVNMPGAEAREAIERGTIDGLIFPWSYGFGAYGIHEVSKHAALFGLGSKAGFVIINLDTWNKLDPRVQEIMREASQNTPEVYAEAYGKADEKYVPEFKAKGVDIYPFTPEDVAKIREMAQSLWDDAVADTEAKGLPAREVLDALLAAIAKHE